MIIFDTNAVDLLNPMGLHADIIRKLRQSGHHRVAVPWMVLEEMAAHKSKLYPTKHQAAVKALSNLREILPWELESALEALDVERLLSYWRGAYSNIFEVIETSGEVTRKALAREAMTLPPAKRKGDHSEGARDVAIWFSIIEFLKENPDEHVCFVTNNTTDFSDGITYPYPMDDDLHGLEHRPTRLRDFNEVVSQFTTEVSGENAETAASELLETKAVRSRVAQTAEEDLVPPAGLTGLGAEGATEQWSEWLMPPEVELLAVTDVTGHEIEGDVWYTAKARWLLYGFAACEAGTGDQDIACVWEMKVLFSAQERGKAPTFLSTSEPSLPDTSDTLTMESLKRLKERVARMRHRTVQNFHAALSPAGNLLARSLAAAMPQIDTNILGRSLARTIIPALSNPTISEIAYRGIANQVAASHAKLGLRAMTQRANEEDENGEQETENRLISPEDDDNQSPDSGTGGSRGPRGE